MTNFFSHPGTRWWTGGVVFELTVTNVLYAPLCNLYIYDPVYSGYADAGSAQDFVSIWSNIFENR